MNNTAVPFVAAAVAILCLSSASATASKEGLAERPRDAALTRAVNKICREGRCQRDDALTTVTVWRDKKSAPRLLRYESAGCSHPAIAYHDARGKFLVAEQTGPREPNEWNSPRDRKIDRLKSGLTAAESYSCHDIRFTDR
jgi:hypothetical protein